ncbi:hypothetical protein DPMN_035615 [Dreissena polymorpha]|uniref:Uncharacterized protein n=1 Tax=Dreissena polymorpha TaxID=45954 RepID=A0A9D4RL64_DREPO|nr:hypothetical protein DPMN_035615 [Dreissena polymorpha]
MDYSKPAITRASMSVLCFLELSQFYCIRISAVQHICSHQGGHKVDGVVLRVSPYYQCAAGAIWDTNLHVVPIPKPVNIQILPDQLEFVKA